MLAFDLDLLKIKGKSMKTKNFKFQSFVAGAFALSLLVVIPAYAQSGTATKADVKRLDHEIEMLKSQVAQIQATINQHSKAQPPAGSGQQGMGSQQQSMPMMDDDSMEMPPMGGGMPQGGNQPSGNMPSGGGMGDM